jgi:hypothetical protein
MAVRFACSSRTTTPTRRTSSCVITLGIEISGTVTNARTEHGYDGDYWHLGDLRPGASVSFPIALWIETSPQLTSASGLDLTIELVSPDLAEPLVSTPLRIEAN